MNAVVLSESQREAVIDALTTHRHGGERREPCEYCQFYYGDLVDKMLAVQVGDR